MSYMSIKMILIYITSIAVDLQTNTPGDRPIPEHELFGGSLCTLTWTYIAVLIQPGFFYLLNATPYFFWGGMVSPRIEGVLGRTIV